MSTQEQEVIWKKTRVYPQTLLPYYRITASWGFKESINKITLKKLGYMYSRLVNHNGMIYGMKWKYISSSGPDKSGQL